PNSAFGTPLVTNSDFLKYASGLPQNGGGIQAIADPLAEAKALHITDAVAKSLLDAQFHGQAPNAGTQDAALFSYLSGKIDFTKYRNTVADLTVAEARQAKALQDALPKQEEATRTLTAYEQAQASLAT